LTQKEINYIQSAVVEISQYNHLQRLVQIVNVIASEGAKNNFVALVPEGIADFLLLSNQSVVDAFRLLMKYQLLINTGHYYKLALSTEHQSLA